MQPCITCATYKTVSSLAFIKSPAKIDLSLWHDRQGKPQDGNLLLPQAKQDTLEKAGGKWQEQTLEEGRRQGWSFIMSFVRPLLSLTGQRPQQGTWNAPCFRTP